MGRVIAIGNVKGGVGKTTLSTNLAALAAAAGRRVLLVDTDSNGTALMWASARPDDRPSVGTIGLPSPTVRRQVAEMRDDYDLILVDVAGQDSRTFRAALLVADEILIPVTPSAADVWTSDQGTFAVVAELREGREDVGVRVVMNAVISGTRVARDAGALLAEYEGQGFPLTRTRLHSRVAWRHAFGEGLSVAEYETDGKAAGELRALAVELGVTANGEG